MRAALAALAALVGLVLIPGQPALAAVVWSSGNQTADGAGFGPPTDPGCWSRYSGDEGINWILQTTNGTTSLTLSACQALATNGDPGHTGLRFNDAAAEPATTTTTTTAAPTTTTTAAPTTTTTAPPSTVAGSPTVTDPKPRGKLSQFSDGPWAQADASGAGLTGDPASGTGGWNLKQRTGSPSTSWFIEPHTATGAGFSGPMCVRGISGGYYPINNVQVGVFAFSADGISYMWRPTVEQVQSVQGTATANDCQAWYALSVIDPPAVDCYREFLGNNKVRLRARIGNPTGGATDEVRLSVPWEPGDRSGLVAEFDLPAQMVAMPADGWRGLCLVERTVDVPETSSAWITNEIITIGDYTPQDLQNFQMEYGYDNAQPRQGLQAPPVVVTGTSALVAWLAKAGSAAVAVNAPTLATAGGAAVAGWTLGGVVAAGIANWTGDDPWFCQWNPGYRVARDGYCSEVMEQTELQRSQVGLQDESGEWITTTTIRPWKKAWTATEVVINPGKPSVGPRRTTAIAKPQLSNPQQTGLSQSLSQQAGTDRAGVQSTAPNPTISNPATATPTNTDLDPRATDPPPAVVPNGDTGEEASGCWSWNPLSWFKGLACFVRWLLLPTPATTNRLAELWNGLSDKAPFSFVTILGFPAAQFQAMTTTLFASVASGDCLNFSAMGSAEQPIICAGSPDNPGPYNPVPASIFAPARQIMLLLVRLGLVVLLLHYLQRVFN